MRSSPQRKIRHPGVGENPETGSLRTATGFRVLGISGESRPGAKVLATSLSGSPRRMPRAGCRSKAAARRVVCRLVSPRQSLEKIESAELKTLRVDVAEGRIQKGSVKLTTRL